MKRDRNALAIVVLVLVYAAIPFLIYLDVQAAIKLFNS